MKSQNEKLDLEDKWFQQKTVQLLQETFSDRAISKSVVLNDFVQKS